MNWAVATGAVVLMSDFVLGNVRALNNIFCQEGGR